MSAEHSSPRGGEACVYGITTGPLKNYSANSNTDSNSTAEAQGSETRQQHSQKFAEPTDITDCKHWCDLYRRILPISELSTLPTLFEGIRLLIFQAFCRVRIHFCECAHALDASCAKAFSTSVMYICASVLIP